MVVAPLRVPCPIAPYLSFATNINLSKSRKGAYLRHLWRLGGGTASPGILPPGAMMKYNTQNRECHAERSEASVCPSRETLRFAQGDNTLPILVVKIHNRGSTGRLGGWLAPVML